MKNFIKIFSLVLLFSLILVSCFWGNKTELAWENANLVYNVNFKNADFVLTQAKKYIVKDYEKLTEEEKLQNQKMEELFSYFKDTNFGVAVLVWKNANMTPSFDDASALAFNIGNVKSEILKFVKDFKEGFAVENPKSDFKDPEELFNKEKSVADFLKQWKEVWKMLKIEMLWENINDKAALRTKEFIKKLTIWSSNIASQVDDEEGKLKLTWKFKDNKWFQKLSKNLTGKELFYVYLADNLLTKNVDDKVKAKMALASMIINKEGISLNLNAETDWKITEEDDKKAQEFFKEIETKMKENLWVYSMMLVAQIQDESDKKVITDAINSIKIEYKKTSDTSFELKISLKANLDKLFDIFLEKFTKIYQKQIKQAKDTWRIASLNNIQAVLETYFSDFSEYPEENSNWCLSDKDWNVLDINLKKYFSKWKAPLDPNTTHINAPCDIPWVYAYKTLERDWLNDWWYILSTTLENKKWNTSENIDFSKKDYDYYKKNIWVETNSNVYSVLN